MDEVDFEAARKAMNQRGLVPDRRGTVLKCLSDAETRIATLEAELRATRADLQRAEAECALFLDDVDRARNQEPAQGDVYELLREARIACDERDDRIARLIERHECDLAWKQRAEQAEADCYVWEQALADAEADTNVIEGARIWNAWTAVLVFAASNTPAVVLAAADELLRHCHPESAENGIMILMGREHGASIGVNGDDLDVPGYEKGPTLADAYAAIRGGRG